MDSSVGIAPTESQVARLAVEAWRPVPDTLDAEVYYSRTPFIRPIEQIREAVKKAYDFSKPASPFKDNPELYKREMEAEIQRIAKQQEQPIIIKKRIRIKKGLYREDSVRSSQVEEINPETEYKTTYVNSGDPEKGDFTSFKYSHDTKTAFIDDKKTSRWKNPEIHFAPSLGFQISLVLRVVLGKKKNNSKANELIPDPEKIKQITKGEHPDFLVSVRSDTYGKHLVDRFAISAADSPGKALFVINCDRSDYSRMYQCELHDPSGKVVVIEERDGFFDSGFPRFWKKSVYSSGQEVVSENYVFANVTVNPNLPKDIFTFSPHENYGVVDKRPEKTIVTQPRVDDSRERRKGQTSAVHPTAAHPAQVKVDPDSEQITPKSPPPNRPLVVLAGGMLMLIAAMLIWRRRKYN